MDEDVIVLKGGKDNEKKIFKLNKANIAFQETPEGKDWVNFYMNSGDCIHCKPDESGELVVDRIFK